MLAKRLNISTDELGDPASPIWQQVTAQKVDLVPAPVAMQPSKYIVGKWQDGEFGTISALGVQLIHNSDELAFRLEWDDPNPRVERSDNDEFLDAAAILFPLSENTSLMMGLQQAPVNIWYWRADKVETAQNNVASGIGTSKVTEQGNIKIKALYQQGRWTLVFRRKLTVAGAGDDAAQFIAGDTIRAAFAIWDGSNHERGGLKSFSPVWLEATLEA